MVKSPHSTDPADRLLSTDEVARFLDVSAKTVRDWTRSGHLPGIKLGRNTYRFSQAKINAWIEAGSLTTAKGAK